MPVRPKTFKPQRTNAQRFVPPPQKTDPFYGSAAWKRLRDAVKRERPLCGPCERAGLVVVGTVCDHIIPRRLRPDLELDASNCEMNCDRCHAVKRVREREMYREAT